MQIQPISLLLPNTSAGPLAHSSSGARSSSSTNGSSSNPVQNTNSMFLDLLTAQLKNQSPLDPVDPMTFTTQLVQFNMLDQLTQINSVLQQSLNGNTNANGADAISGGN